MQALSPVAEAVLQPGLVGRLRRVVLVLAQSYDLLIGKHSHPPWQSLVCLYLLTNLCGYLVVHFLFSLKFNS